jgi:hypothetical protein
MTKKIKGNKKHCNAAFVRKKGYSAIHIALNRGFLIQQLKAIAIISIFFLKKAVAGCAQGLDTMWRVYAEMNWNWRYLLCLSSQPVSFILDFLPHNSCREQ